MIGRLQGILEAKTPPFLLVEVSGVGYEVQAPLSTFYHLPALQEKVTLFTHLYVREDIQVLYGFIDQKERALFRALIKISGVGPKMALTILSGMTVPEFIQCMEGRDISVLTKLPGVGKKTAERLVVELAGKLKNDFEEAYLLNIKKSGTEQPTAQMFYKTQEQELLSALLSLGYKPQEASWALSKLDLSVEQATAEQATENFESLIKRALKTLAKA